MGHVCTVISQIFENQRTLKILSSFQKTPIHIRIFLKAVDETRDLSEIG